MNAFCFWHIYRKRSQLLKNIKYIYVVEYERQQQQHQHQQPLLSFHTSKRNKNIVCSPADKAHSLSRSPLAHSSCCILWSSRYTHNKCFFYRETCQIDDHLFVINMERIRRDVKRSDVVRMEIRLVYFFYCFFAFILNGNFDFWQRTWLFYFAYL